MSMKVDQIAGSQRGAGTSGGVVAALAQDVAVRARGLWDAYWDYQARRATVLMLEKLDDRILKDIGLTRSQIWPAVLGADWAEEGRYHPHWWKPLAGGPKSR